MKGVLRVSFHEQVHVVGHDLQGDDPPPMLGGLDPDQLLASVLDRPVQNRAAVFRAEHHVIPEVVRAASGNLNFAGHANNYARRTYLTAAPRWPGTRFPCRLKAAVPSRGL